MLLIASDFRRYYPGSWRLCHGFIFGSFQLRFFYLSNIYCTTRCYLLHWNPVPGSVLYTPASPRAGHGLFTPPHAAYLLHQIFAAIYTLWYWLLKLAIRSRSGSPFYLRPTKCFLGLDWFTTSFLHYFNTLPGIPKYSICYFYACDPYVLDLIKSWFTSLMSRVQFLLFPATGFDTNCIGSDPYWIEFLPLLSMLVTVKFPLLAS